MRTITLCILLIASSALTAAGAGSDSREEARRYDTLAVTGEGCRTSGVMDGSVCFALAPGDRFVEVRIREESATASLGWPIAAVLWFPGFGVEYHFCDAKSVKIPDGVTEARVLVQQGYRNGFCGPDTEFSPAVYGTVTATFSDSWTPPADAGSEINDLLAWSRAAVARGDPWEASVTEWTPGRGQAVRGASWPEFEAALAASAASAPSPGTSQWPRATALPAKPFDVGVGAAADSALNPPDVSARCAPLNTYIIQYGIGSPPSAVVSTGPASAYAPTPPTPGWCIGGVVAPTFAELVLDARGARGSWSSAQAWASGETLHTHAGDFAFAVHRGVGHVFEWAFCSLSSCILFTEFWGYAGSVELYAERPPMFGGLGVEAPCIGGHCSA